jgi:adenosylcobinamide kinase/adenosylcobinamide-phosphate guanylyltransferase
MGKLIFITGGAASGKSTFAQELADSLSEQVTYIAPAEAKDKEMELRIRIHRRNRPGHWKTIEEKIDVAGVLSQVADKNEVVLLDCLTLLVSNLLLSGEKKILEEIKELVDKVKKMKATLLVVSNEVGMGIVPDNNLARQFRDIAGRANQLIARAADEVYLVVSGIPVKVKKEGGK